MLSKQIIGLVCLAAGALTPGARAQDAARPVFRSSIAVVPISVVVRDSHGRPVTTLKASDFQVRDNGEPRPIRTFALDDATPLTVAVLVDTSGSMRLESKLAAARDVVAGISSALRDGVDAIGLFAFDAALRELHGFTDHPALVQTTLSDATPFGATSLYDAIAETAHRLADRASARHAIVVLTDGIDTSSALPPAEAAARASAIDVPVYIVATVPTVDRERYIDRAASPNAHAAADARDLARWTGGDLVWATNEAGARAAARQIVTELRSQYFLAIDSADDSTWRRLEVSVRNRRLTVRARSGYVGRDATASGMREQR